MFNEGEKIMKRRILMVFLVVTIILLTSFLTNAKIYASTSCTADEAITKVQSLVGTTVRL